MKYEPANILDEAERSEEARDTFLASLPEMNERRHGSAYRSDKTSRYNPDNHEHDFISHVLPQVAFANPKVNTRGRSGDISRMIAQAMKLGLNRWVEDQKLNEVNQAVCVDGFFTYGVFITIYEPAPWAKANDYEVVHLPVVRRLSPYQFLMDSLCPDYRMAKWLGHDNAWDYDELCAECESNPDSGWNASLVHSLNADKDEIKWRDQRLRRFAPDRNEVLIREIWCPGCYLPGYGPYDGGGGKYSGTIFTVAKGQSGMSRDDWIREPRPYFGPPWGMYTLFGVHKVPELPYPLGPLCAQKPAADGVNEIGRVCDDAVKGYKRQEVVDASNTDLIQKLKGAKNGELVVVRGFKKDDIAQLERGGLTNQMLEMYDFRRSRLDRVASMSETLRGNAEGSKTATAESIASTANQTTIGFIRQRFQAAVTQVVDTAGWYAYNDSRFQVKLGEDAAQQTGMNAPTFYGDPQGLYGAMMGLDGPMQIGEYRDVVEVSIENHSMDMVTSDMARMQGLQALQVMQGMWQTMPQMPYVRWADVMAWVGDMFNDDRIAKFADPNVAMQMQGLPGSLPPSPQMQMSSASLPSTAQKKPSLSGSSSQYTVQNTPLLGKVNASNPMVQQMNQPPVGAKSL